jgi:hypothetical protein
MAPGMTALASGNARNLLGDESSSTGPHDAKAAIKQHITLRRMVLMDAMGTPLPHLFLA